MYEDRETLVQEFGLDAGLDHHGHPASALHGPFLNLLYLHPLKGLRLVIDTINRCSAAYQAGRGEGLECRFDLPDGRVVQHVGDAQLWAMYRTNSGPDVLRSMLMALERWLLELGAHFSGSEFRALVINVMAQSTSLALSSVVASVVLAFPDELGDVGVAFLKHKDLIYVDRGRWRSDQTNTDKIMAEVFPAFGAENMVYNDERVKSAALRHRRLSLESLAQLLQTGPLREHVQGVIDEHLAALPREDEQGDEDRYWRFALHRMDLRNVRMREEPDGSTAVLIAAPPADVQALLDRERPAAAAIERGIAVYNWGNARYERRDDEAYPAKDWRARLEHARSQPPVPYADPRLIVATVCLRDVFAELSDEERAWCLDVVCAAFAGDASRGGEFGMGPASGTREAARQLGGILATLTDPIQKQSVEVALTRALLVKEHDISRQASIGIGQELWSSDPRLVKSFATALDSYTRQEFKLSYSSRRMAPEDEQDLEGAASAREQLKRRMIDAVSERRVDMAAIVANDYHKSPARFVIRQLSDMLCSRSDDVDAHAFALRLSDQLRVTWDADRRGKRRLDGERLGFDHQTELFVADALCFAALGLGEGGGVALMTPYRDLAHEHPEKVAKLLHQLTQKECDRHRPDVFWSIWRMLAEALIKWVNETPRVSHTILDPIAEAVFLGLDWFPTTTSWRSMVGHDAEVVEAFAQLRPCEEGIERFAKHLLTIGRVLLPDVIPVVAQKLGQPGAVLSENAVDRLERAFANLIYTGAPRLRQEQVLREATLVVLGALIEAGSSRAYRMRDDFVTPLRVEPHS